MLLRLVCFVAVLGTFPFVEPAVSQTPEHSLHSREVPCQTQYAKAVQTIGLARWSAPEAERPSIERLLNAASKAKELVDASFLQWEQSLCSTETLSKLHVSVDRLESNHWVPTSPEDLRAAQAAAANAELLKAMDAGMNPPAGVEEGRRRLGLSN